MDLPPCAPMNTKITNFKITKALGFIGFFEAQMKRVAWPALRLKNHLIIIPLKRTRITVCSS